MEFLPQDPLLELLPDTITSLRKLYGLDEPERMEESLKILEEWIQKQNHFIMKTFSEYFLYFCLM